MGVLCSRKDHRFLNGNELQDCIKFRKWVLTQGHGADSDRQDQAELSPAVNDLTDHNGDHSEIASLLYPASDFDFELTDLCAAGSDVTPFIAGDRTIQAVASHCWNGRSFRNMNVRQWWITLSRLGSRKRH